MSKSFAELMFKFHNRTRSVLNSDIADHVFYEGFEVAKDDPECPVLYLEQGS